jgi:hypothetical protein
MGRRPFHRLAWWLRSTFKVWPILGVEAGLDKVADRERDEYD